MAHFRHSYVILFTSILLPAALIFQPAKASVASDSTTGISAGSNTTDSAASARLWPTCSTSSLGTSFLVGAGVPINTSSQLQTTSDSSRSARLTAGKGVDMRAISTDHIESVEIVRGIPSAEYGDLTSGLVKIKRKSGPSGIEARFKADMQSQLFYIGKGFAMPAPDWNINLSASYLDSRIDPRNNRDNFLWSRPVI